MVLTFEFVFTFDIFFQVPDSFVILESLCILIHQIVLALSYFFLIRTDDRFLLVVRIHWTEVKFWTLFCLFGFLWNRFFLWFFISIKVIFRFRIAESVWSIINRVFSLWNIPPIFSFLHFVRTNGIDLSFDLSQNTSIDLNCTFHIVILWFIIFIEARARWIIFRLILLCTHLCRIIYLRWILIPPITCLLRTLPYLRKLRTFFLHLPISSIFLVPLLRILPTLMFARCAVILFVSWMRILSRWVQIWRLPMFGLFL